MLKAIILSPIYILKVCFPCKLRTLLAVCIMYMCVTGIAIQNPDNLPHSLPSNLQIQEIGF